MIPSSVAITQVEHNPSPTTYLRNQYSIYQVLPAQRYPELNPSFPLRGAHANNLPPIATSSVTNARHCCRPLPIIAAILSPAMTIFSDLAVAKDYL
jgi:hypothetical protein